MNDITHSGFGGETPATMSTREIAELTSKRHDHVMRDTRVMLVELYGEGDLPNFGGVYRGGNGEDRPCFNLPKRECLILVSGYSVELRAKIIDRWQELEERQRDPMAILADPATVRTMLLVYSERLMLAEPKAQAYDRLATSDGSLCVTDAAKTIQARPRDLFSYLRRQKWIYTRAGTSSEIAYQDKIQAGYLEHKVTTVSRSDGSEKSVTQVRVTPKGLARLAKEWPQPPLAH